MPPLKPLTRENLVWRTTPCAAFNWHNELLELDLEPEVRPWTSP
ncbi:MAG TPA: hypothetical protein VMQ51_11430 [Candidatus Binatia bacterium]|nr:hypothetical protein [Candidatus Binatia bacterium]